MKNFYLFLIALFSFAMAKSQNYVIVQGTITTTTGAAVNNWPVYIIPDSTTSPAGCNLYHVAHTNANGYYRDTLPCNTVHAVTVYTANCNNTNVYHYDTVPSNRVVTDNFVICTPGTVVCHAAFTYNVSGTIAFFNSSNSVGSTDTIVRRVWRFGDGMTLTGNVVQPTHTYTSPGTYTVWLRINTANNQCVDSTSQIVVIPPYPITCIASFSDTVIGHSVYSNSMYSHAGTGDSITERHWTFGDNTAAVTGNVVAPTHTYTANGTYNICLKIHSARGCSDSICKTVIITGISTTCLASFTATHSGNVYAFNSSASQTPAPDVIIRRKWEFGNGDTLGGNVITPTHTYTQNGYNTVTLTIFTQNGCSSTYSLAINVYDSSCHAAFNYSNTSAATAISFVSTSTSGAGAAVAYAWNFGDNSVSTLASPTHAYNAPGTYNVCLTISTSTGCQSSVCHPVVIQGSTNACHAVIAQTGNGTFVGQPYTFNSGSSTAAIPDTIYQRFWSFGDGASLGGNNVYPSHIYTTPGTHTVLLIITSTGGCRDTAYATILVSPTTTACHASFFDSAYGRSVYFISSLSSTPSPDSIVERHWTFGDGTSLGGNVVVPFHQYANAGTYTVCLRINAASGCKDSVCHTITVTNPNTTCHAIFTVNDSTNTAQFMSYNSTAPTGDSIITRNWSFGDGSGLGGNIVAPLHTYAQSGTYVVCLTISTHNGCQSSYCDSITIVVPPPPCVANFKYLKTTPNTVLFNSGASMAAPGDSIISRRWTFGDGSVLLGNVVSPSKTYQQYAMYNVCLRISTASGCISEKCVNVRVGDSTIIVDTSVKVQILSVFPVPATTQITTLIWSKYNGVTAEIAVIDIYGVKKWSTRKTLFSSTNSFVIPTNSLLAGPYTLRVTTIFGVLSKRFYKL